MRTSICTIDTSDDGGLRLTKFTIQKTKSDTFFFIIGFIVCNSSRADKMVHCRFKLRFLRVASSINPFFIVICSNMCTCWKWRWKDCAPLTQCDTVGYCDDRWWWWWWLSAVQGRCWRSVVGPLRHRWPGGQGSMSWWGPGRVTSWRPLLRNPTISHHQTLHDRPLQFTMRNYSPDAQFVILFALFPRMIVNHHPSNLINGDSMVRRPWDYSKWKASWKTKQFPLAVFPYKSRF